MEAEIHIMTCRCTAHPPRTPVPIINPALTSISSISREQGIQDQGDRVHRAPLTLQVPLLPVALIKDQAHLVPPSFPAALQVLQAHLLLAVILCGLQCLQPLQDQPWVEAQPFLRRTA